MTVKEFLNIFDISSVSLFTVNNNIVNDIWEYADMTITNVSVFYVTEELTKRHLIYSDTNPGIVDIPRNCYRVMLSLDFKLW